MIEFVNFSDAAGEDGEKKEKVEDAAAGESAETPAAAS